MCTSNTEHSVAYAASRSLTVGRPLCPAVPTDPRPPLPSRTAADSLAHITACSPPPPQQMASASSASATPAAASISSDLLDRALAEEQATISHQHPNDARLAHKGQLQPQAATVHSEVCTSTASRVS